MWISEQTSGCKHPANLRRELRARLAVAVTSPCESDKNTTRKSDSPTGNARTNKALVDVLLMYPRCFQRAASAYVHQDAMPLLARAKIRMRG